MSDYNELVRRLREPCQYENCVMSQEAADAIEELQKALERSKEYETFWEKEATEALKKFQVAVASKPRWTPVTERLPEEEVEVLISDNSFFGGPIVAVAYWERGKCEWRDDMCTSATPKPTHWMPLPEPPKEVDE